MGCLTIKVEADPGTMIAEAAKEAQDLADKLNMSVEFQFNEVYCCALPGGCYSKIVKDFHEAIDRDKKYKHAFS